ncbi:MAG TPA: PDZ domain-containing protein [Ramlibacter sp.]|nr:PDZ domain-containing protein [Ramlibacter sp.]
MGEMHGQSQHGTCGKRLGSRNLNGLLPSVLLFLSVQLHAQEPPQPPLPTASSSTQMNSPLNQRVRAVGRRLNLAFRPVCAPHPDVGAIPFALKIGENRLPVTLRFLVAGGVADAAGLKEGDVLHSVNGIPTQDKSTAELSKLWVPALAEALQGGTPVSLVVAQPGDSSGGRRVDLTPESHCGFRTGTHNVARDDVGLRDIVLGTKELPEDVADDALAFIFSRYIAFMLLAQGSTGHQLKGAGLAVNLLAAIAGKPMNSTLSSLTPYTENDFLKADLLAMVAMRAAGYSLTAYVANAEQANRRRTSVISTIGLRPWPRLSDDSWSKLRQMQAWVEQGNVEAAAALVSMGDRLSALKTVASSNSASAPPARNAVRPVLPLAPPADTAGVAAEPPKSARSGYARLDDIDAIPWVSNACRERYRNWLGQANPKAYAIGPSGRCGFSWGMRPPQPDLPANPAERAVLACTRVSDADCLLYAVDDQVVWKP